MSHGQSDQNVLLQEAAREAFDRLTRLAANATNAPVALVTVLDADQQHFLGTASMGPPWDSIRGTPLSHSFCRHVVETGSPLVVEDARSHPVVKGNPAIEELDVLAYAGVPMTTSDGVVIGTVCAIDHKPRHWAPRELDLLREIAALSLSRIELTVEVQKRRRVEAALSASEIRFRVLVENLEDIIFLADEGARITYHSASAERVLGYRLDDMVGTHALDLMHPDEREAMAVAIRAILDHPGAVQVGSVRLQDRRDQTWRVVEYTAKNLLHEPAVRSLVVIARDISRHKALEEQARQAQKLDALGRMAGGVAHDFNNVLTAIRGFASVPLGELEPDTTVHADIQQVVAAADRGTRLTRQLLSFSRTQPAESADLDLVNVVRQMEGLLRRLLGEGVRLRLVLPGGAVIVRADQGEMEQVVMNLVLNARDAMPDGGEVVVELGGPTRLPSGTLPIEQHDFGDYAVLSVSDTGVGIPSEHIDRIFNPLFTTKAPDRGTGLGLSTVYSVVVRSRGALKVSSEVGSGTTISVFLPVATAQE